MLGALRSLLRTLLWDGSSHDLEWSLGVWNGNGSGNGIFYGLEYIPGFLLSFPGTLGCTVLNNDYREFDSLRSTRIMNQFLISFYKKPFRQGKRPSSTRISNYCPSSPLPHPPPHHLRTILLIMPCRVSPSTRYEGFPQRTLL